jgi:hypothetical protein
MDYPAYFIEMAGQDSIPKTTLCNLRRLQLAICLIFGQALLSIRRIKRFKKRVGPCFPCELLITNFECEALTRPERRFVAR